MLRIFKVDVVPELQEEFEDNFKVISLGLVNSEEGLLFAEIGKSTTKNDTAYIMISAWETLDALKAFTGPQWEEAVIPETMQKYVVSFKLEHYSDF